MINVKNINALSELYPSIVRTVGDVAYDTNGNEVAYDLQAITAKVEADAQAEIEIKQSAVSKLSALGLTDAEIKALTGINL